MANPRWWSFEDRRVNFGGIQPDTTDIAKLLLHAVRRRVQQRLVPRAGAAGFGAIADVRGLVVTNVFGERLWIDAAGRAPEHAWQRWSMFTLNHAGGAARQAGHRVARYCRRFPKFRKGRTLEECVLVRDEMANMVWGMEATVPLPHGVGPVGERSGGRDVAVSMSGCWEVLRLALPLQNEAKARYEVMNAVPENWIPFIPVHVAGSNREIQLQRANMPRMIENSAAPIEKVKPRTSASPRRARVESRTSLFPSRGGCAARRRSGSPRHSTAHAGQRASVGLARRAQAGGSR